MSASSNLPASSFFHRHEFLIRRLHSLSGLVPVGAYMCVHLLTNASLTAGAETFQNNVFAIHSLPMLPLIEWLFIFLPIIFHAVVGVWIARTGRSNLGNYPLPSNRRYTWQRITAYIAIVFIFTHVFHLHGWFHNEWWLKNIAEPLGMAQFRPYNATSTLARALGSLQSVPGIAWIVFYVVGVLACVFHLANGIWTAGITWGVWLTPKAQQTASMFCLIFGIALAGAGLSSLVAVKSRNPDADEKTEFEMTEARIKSKSIAADPHKQTQRHTEKGDVKPAPVGGQK